jgi:class 3 adenylate cyclase/tetratricopeptide (TPR) repeat protein
MACGAALTPGARLTGIEERKVVTVLFCDLVGFTARSDQRDPEEIQARLLPYHRRMQQQIERFGGTVEKFIGDAVVGTFGVPTAHEDDPERAVRAALGALEAIEEMNQASPGLDLAIRVAVNTGEAVVSLGARPEQGEHSVTGDVTNTASRLQGVAPVGGVVVGEATYQATMHQFHYEELQPVRVKGKIDPVTIWRALRPRSRFGVDVDLEPSTPMVDREVELTLLTVVYERAVRESSVQLINIVGEPGVGKSRLVREFRAWIDARPELVPWRQGRCLAYGEGVTFWALGEVVKAQAEILESDDVVIAAQKLAQAVEQVGIDGAEREWLTRRLGLLVGLVGGVEATADNREEMFTAWRRFLEAIAAQRQFIVVFEDLHWADPALLAFTRHLVEWASGVPLLVVTTARPELYDRSPDWGGGLRNATTISLEPLSDADTARLVTALLDQAILPAEIQAALVERTGGNPLYTEEVVRMLGERGALKRQGRTVRLNLGAALIFPDSIQALIAARLDTLTPERKALLQDAAVVGMVFWAGALCAMGNRDPAAVRADLHELTRREFVRPARLSSVNGEAEYAFWHALTREVAYSRLPRTVRAVKHAAAAAWIEQLAGERVADHAEVLAHHYGTALELSTQTAATADMLAGLQASARRFLIMAGDRAIGLDVGRAVEYYGKALDLLPRGEPGRGRVLAKTGEAAARAGRFVEAESAYTEAIAELRALGDPLGAGDTMVKLSNMLWRRGQTARSRDILGKAMALLQRERPSVELVNAFTEMAGHMALQGRLQEAATLLERSLALARSLDADEPVPRALGFRGAVRCELGDLSGLDDLQQALDLALKMGLGREAARMRGLQAEVLWATEGPARALNLSRNGIELAERRGSTDLAMALRAETLRPLFDLGDWDVLLQVAGQVLHWAQPEGERYFTLLAQSQRARVLVCRGEVTSAATLTDDFLQVAREVGDLQVLVTALAVAAFVKRARDDLGAAIGLIEELERVTRDRSGSYRAQYACELVRTCVAGGAMDLAEGLIQDLIQGVEASVKRHVLSLLTSRAILEEALGNLERASKAFQEAALGWREFGFLLEEGQARLGSGRTLVQLRRPEGSDSLRAARAIFLRLQAMPLLAETDRWLALAA